MIVELFILRPIPIIKPVRPQSMRKHGRAAKHARAERLKLIALAAAMLAMLFARAGSTYAFAAADAGVLQAVKALLLGPLF